MRIGLLRHFPVAQKSSSGLRTAAEMQAWLERYDLAGVVQGDFDLGGVSWQACLSSDQPRARLTADVVFRGEVRPTALLREVQIAQFNTGSLRLPVWAWRWLLRLAWSTGHRSQRACRDDCQKRVLAVADRLSDLEQDTLVVSHAGIMAFLSAELRRRGFAGPRLRYAKHATAYIYERNGGESASARRVAGHTG